MEMKRPKETLAQAEQKIQKLKETVSAVTPDTKEIEEIKEEIRREVETLKRLELEKQRENVRQKH